MAELKAKVQRLTIEEHPNADALELAVIGGYRAIVKKDQFKTGDLAVYIPEQSVLPQWVVKQLGLEGRLAGKESNRVKAVKLRGVLSQGLVFPLELDRAEVMMMGRRSDDFLLYYFKTPDGREVQVEEGDDVTEHLGIVKYEPPVPTSMSGQVWNAMGKTIKYDIENWKNYPDILEEGEEVVFTEKLHGTWACFGYYGGEYIIGSKGLSAKGLAFKLNEANQNNIYVRQFEQHGGRQLVDTLRELSGRDDVFILGEIFGKGVQDLSYGMQQPSFRIFDIYFGNPQTRGDFGSFYCNFDMLVKTVDDINNIAGEEIARLVPSLYVGPFSKEVMEEYTSGNETVSGKQMNIREGIVMKPVEEREHAAIGRVILKSVSENYLLRKGGTEYN